MGYNFQLRWLRKNSVKEVNFFFEQANGFIANQISAHINSLQNNQYNLIQ